MILNALFQNVKIYNVQDRLDVVKGQAFTLEMSEPVPNNLRVFHDNDPVIAIDGNKITAEAIGTSLVRFMVGTEIEKDLEINVVESINPMASSLNTTFGQPVDED